MSNTITIVQDPKNGNFNQEFGIGTTAVSSLPQGKFEIVMPGSTHCTIKDRNGGVLFHYTSNPFQYVAHFDTSNHGIATVIVEADTEKFEGFSLGQLHEYNHLHHHHKIMIILLVLLFCFLIFMSYSRKSKNLFM